MDEKKKRKVTFHPDVQEDLSAKKSKNLPPTTTTTTATNDGEENESRLHRGKYALDSDEEDQDDLDEQKQMNEEELNDIGQEKATIGFDDDVKITPFNIDEELEDGHYDESGCFQWKKKNKDDIRDAWLDEIDWTNVKNYKLKTNSNEENEEKMKTNDQIDSNKFDEKSTLESMLKLMQPGESVTRTIKRLGTSISKNSKSKSKGKEKVRRLLPGEIAPLATKSDELTDEELKKNQILFDEMSGLADQFVSNGDLDIYQETYERLKSKFDRLHSSSTKMTPSNFDMYGDDDISTSVQTNNSNSDSRNKEIRWEYLIDGNDCSTIEGPLTTEEMIRLGQNEGKVDLDKVKCRRQGTEQFYSIKRIDFDLYLD